MNNPFEYGGVYRVRADFEAARDRFVADELLMYWRHGSSVYDGMQGYFFRQPDSERVRSWDISLGADPTGWTELFEIVAAPDPLIAAARSDDTGAVEAALRDDGDALSRLSFELALEAAAEQGAQTALERLMQRPTPDALRLRVFMAAASAGREATLRAMLDAGTDVQMCDRVGQTALTAAAFRGDVGSVQLLLARGADPGHATSNGSTALSLARARKHDAVVALLEEAIRERGPSGPGRPL